MGAPHSLDGGGPGWRSATAVLVTTAVLVLGAAVAGYAALSKSSPPKPPRRVVTVAQAPPPTTGLGTAGAGTAGTEPGSTAGGLGAPALKPQVGAIAKPPKIPLAAVTPKPAQTKSALGGLGLAGVGLGTPKKKKSSAGANGSEPESAPTPILLDTNAASTYNPYAYPAAEFGDPRLVIDGEASTAWTAAVQPAVAPKMAEGLVIDLKTARTVGSVTLVSSTPGMTVQMYGANGATLPPSITDPAWTALSGPHEAKQKTHLKLHDANKGFRYVLLWISKAPASAVGTPQAPGHVSLNELELFPPK